MINFGIFYCLFFILVDVTLINIILYDTCFAFLQGIQLLKKMREGRRGYEAVDDPNFIIYKLYISTNEQIDILNLKF